MWTYVSCFLIHRCCPRYETVVTADQNCGSEVCGVRNQLLRKNRHMVAILKVGPKNCSIFLNIAAMDEHVEDSCWMLFHVVSRIILEWDKNKIGFLPIPIKMITHWFRMEFQIILKKLIGIMKKYMGELEWGTVRLWDYETLELSLRPDLLVARAGIYIYAHTKENFDENPWEKVFLLGHMFKNKSNTAPNF